jgi:GT2 family glycosyltransferase
MRPAGPRTSSGTSNGLRRRIAVAWTFLEVHFDALLLSPGAYLTALKWRILGKRVRARGQFAPLLARSRKAYHLWALTRPIPPRDQDTAPRVTIIVPIMASGSAEALDATLASLSAEGLQPHIIGASPQDDLLGIARAIAPDETCWIMPQVAGDRLAADAAQTYSVWIAHADPISTVLYADDDRIDPLGLFSEPHLKPDWNPELFRHHDFLTGACVVRAQAADLVQVAARPDWARALVEQATQRGAVVHVPTILHHRSSRPAAPRTLAPVEPAAHLPLVSVIIPTRNRADLLRTCITGLRATRYPALEIIVANNDSDEPETLAYLAALAEEGVTILDQPGPFNYPDINNNAVAVAKGELLCLMNNDIEVLAPDWLAIMATQALRLEVGAVGAQLLYPDGRIQHAGVVIGVGNAAGHAHRFLRPDGEGYFRRHALPQFVTAVTAACLVVRKDRFIAVGGLDGANFAVAFNDVDLCLKLNARGWQSFYEPRAVLVHHESVSRGHDTDPVGAARFAGELAALQRIWRTDQIVDPYHHPMLSRASEQFVLDLTATMVRA